MMKVTVLEIFLALVPAVTVTSTSVDSPGAICWPLGHLVVVQPQLLLQSVIVTGLSPVLTSRTVPVGFALAATVPRSSWAGMTWTVEA